MHVRFPALALMLLASAGMALAEPAKTSKERLSDKGSDEQRIDNCRVPPERRGPVARPDCPVGATSAAAKTKSGAPAPR